MRDRAEQVGDAELDEGNVFETLLETWKLGVKNNWFIVPAGTGGCNLEQWCKV